MGIENSSYIRNAFEIKTTNTVLRIANDLLTMVKNKLKNITLNTLIMLNSP